MTEETRGPGGGYGQDVMNTQNACKKHAHKLELDSECQSKQKKNPFQPSTLLSLDYSRAFLLLRLMVYTSKRCIIGRPAPFTWTGSDVFGFDVFGLQCQLLLPLLCSGFNYVRLWRIRVSNFYGILWNLQ